MHAGLNRARCVKYMWPRSAVDQDRSTGVTVAGVDDQICLAVDRTLGLPAKLLVAAARNGREEKSASEKMSGHKLN